MADLGTPRKVSAPLHARARAPRTTRAKPAPRADRQSSRLPGDFFDLLTHELRTPLTSIKGYVDLLLDGVAGPVLPAQRDFLHVVKRGADRLVTLVDDLLDVTRLEAGRITLSRAPVHVHHLTQGALDALLPQIEAKRQDLRLHIPPSLPPIHGDAARVLQILLNVLSHAHRYTPEGGQIAVHAYHEGANIRIEVADSSDGLEPQQQAEVFDAFFRTRYPTISRTFGGTGLDLTIARLLVELHGGVIDAISTPGQGTTFSFILPVTTLEPIPAGEPAPADESAPAAESAGR